MSALDNVIADASRSDAERIVALLERDLRGARMLALVPDTEYVATMETEGRDYREGIYAVAWERADQCGTHRANVNSKGEGMLVWGHYDMTRDEALADLIERTPRFRKGAVGAKG